MSNKKLQDDTVTVLNTGLGWLLKVVILGFIGVGIFSWVLFYLLWGLMEALR